jgi:hypothetical protein
MVGAEGDSTTKLAPIGATIQAKASSAHAARGPPRSDLWENAHAAVKTLSDEDAILLSQQHYKMWVFNRHLSLHKEAFNRNIAAKFATLKHPIVCRPEYCL